MAKLKQKSVQNLSSDMWGLPLIAVGILTLLSCISYTLHPAKENWLGFFGNTTGMMLHMLFGLSSFLIPILTGILGICILFSCRPNSLKLSLIFGGLTVFAAAMLLSVFEDSYPHWAIPFGRFFYPQWTRGSVAQHLGGAPSFYFYKELPALNLKTLFNPSGVVLIFSSLLVASILYLFKMPLQEAARWALVALKELPKKIKSKKEELVDAEEKGEPIRKIKLKIPELARPKKVEEEPIAPIEPKKSSGYSLPPLTLLTPPKKEDFGDIKKDLKRQADILEETMMSFGIEAKVGQINCGPTITSFEVHPAIGVKVQKIKTLENDIALNMEAKSIRIIAPIPGKAAVGIEVPNIHPQEVGFKDMLGTYKGMKKQFKVPFLLGKAVNGDYVMSDLTKMPHCIIAGATGSGKSVCINTIVMAILMTMRPDEIRLLMIDPKKVELTPYSRLPHMIAPVITEPHGAANALNWLVREMEMRYEILKQIGVRNIEGFNERKRDRPFEESLSIEVPEKLPYIVAIIDELADLMMVSTNDIETPIARMAQMARAVGIHLILATQRPSREVITGLIKANFPTRISFKVASRINSQIVLDEVGAESLLGNGDMLFLPPGTSQLVRAQGAFIRDEDIHMVIQYIEKMAPPNYQIHSFDALVPEDEEESFDNKDSLFNDAVRIVQSAQLASTTFLQRKLKIGYARAASLMDQLEERGYISEADGSKPRRVLKPPK